jgi:hypothetical protein
VQVDYVWIVLFMAAMAGLWWLAYRIEPHYSSKDGRRFLCTAQEVEGGEPTGRPKETRVIVMDDGALHCTQKKMMRRSGALWVLVGKSPTPPKRLEVYVAQQFEDGRATQGQLALRVPSKSRVVPVLDAALSRRGSARGNA